MFGALNRFIGRLDGEPNPQSLHSSSDSSSSSYGFQVLKNTNPAIALEPWFDFIIGINGHYIESPSASLFSTEIRNCAGSFATLDLWTAKGQRTYSMTVPIPRDPEKLGLSLQLAPLSSTQNIWHILAVPDAASPAFLAGLLPHSDYILGSPSGNLHGESALGELVEDHLNRTLNLWVYNSEFDIVRDVELVPKRGWGGEGALGAVLGYGALHRLPVGLGEEIQGPGEAMFDADRKSGELGVGDAASAAPSNGALQAPPQTLSPPPLLSPNIAPPPMMSAMETPPPPSSKHSAARTKKARHQPGLASPKSAFDDMFAEGEKKSAEQDFTASRKGAALAPPPKIGAPTTPPTPSTAETASEPKADDGEPGDAEET